MKFMEEKKKKWCINAFYGGPDSRFHREKCYKIVNKKEYNIANEDLQTCTPYTVFFIPHFANTFLCLKNPTAQV